MRWGWVDLIASIPMIEPLRAGRLLRLIRLLRVMRAFQGTGHVIRHIYKNKAKGAVITVSLIGILLTIFCSIAILYFEKDPGSNIKTAEDAIWWVFTTVTTVGYGDKYPVTSGGRIIAMILMTSGVSLFGVFTAYIASWFVVDEQAHHEQ
jgi:voltage-gated potassium channel